MTAKYQLLVHPELRDQLRELHAEAQQNPSGPEAQEFEAVRQGLSVLRDGREAEFSGERLGYSDRHADLRVCAEIKLPVVQEFNRRGRQMGPSHRLTYREFEGPTPGDLPIRQPIAFEPRKDGRPFEVTAGRLGRTRGVPMSELQSLPNVAPAIGEAKDASRPAGPARQALPADLAQAMKGLEGLSSASGAATPPIGEHQRPASRGGPSSGPTRER
jgi:hypothetical protein